ncbi:coiled-coil domain-containing protein 97 isoform X6 [Struthio camelus]|uniref:coiled-coil domain-containing protein 97 isoform X6 n=1 Tax=Struthio camelus TaxID=8801 RepID=UPI003603C5EF
MSPGLGGLPPCSPPPPGSGCRCPPPRPQFGALPPYSPPVAPKSGVLRPPPAPPSPPPQERALFYGNSALFFSFLTLSGRRGGGSAKGSEGEAARESGKAPPPPPRVTFYTMSPVPPPCTCCTAGEVPRGPTAAEQVPAVEQRPRVTEQPPSAGQHPAVLEQDHKATEQQPKVLEQHPMVEQEPWLMEQHPVVVQDPKVTALNPMVEQEPRLMERPPTTVEDPAGAAPDPAAVEAMLAAVAGSRLRVRSQQQGEPELTAAERTRELRELFHRKPLVFLERFHGALGAEHLGCFAHLGARYEVAFYCEEVRRAARDARRRHRDTRRRNRRYAALQQLIQGGEYFSEEEMRAREPLLYEHYIGQYREAEGAPASGPPGAPGPPAAPGPPGAPALGPLARLLLRSVEEAAVQRRLRGQRQREDACAEEEEEESEGEAGAAGPDAGVPDVAERAMLRAEFTSRMHRRFLDGQDGDFDYSQVDDNPELDNLDIAARDAEERYFDGEEPGAAPAPEPE